MAYLRKIKCSDVQTYLDNLDINSFNPLEIIQFNNNNNNKDDNTNNNVDNNKNNIFVLQKNKVSKSFPHFYNKTNLALFYKLHPERSSTIFTSL